MALRVRATKKGYYLRLRREDDVFIIAGKEDFSDRWMELVDEDNKPKKSRAPTRKSSKAKGDNADDLID